MRAAEIIDGKVVNILEVPSLDFLPGLVEAALQGNIGDTWDGNQFITPADPVPTVADYTVAIQAMLDTKVLERRYYNILSACTYATSTNATFNAEGQACVSWRDAVWAKAYDVLAQVEAKTLEQPTVPELLAMLPILTWPA